MTEATQKHSAAGATPEGAADERSAARAVQQMFDDIAPRYDLLNHVLSMNIDRLWWWRTARKFRHILQRTNARVLDLCCGTGDMSLALYRQSRTVDSPYVALDFAPQMLRRGQQKFAGKPIVSVEADALKLPFPDTRFDLVVSAFGFRNLTNYRAGLEEIYRVLAPNGEIGILDFSEPGGLLGQVYAFYFRRVLPRIGTLISGVSGPYSYLPASVEKFPTPEKMQELMKTVGYREVSWTPYSFGIAGLYRGKK